MVNKNPKVFSIAVLRAFWWLLLIYFPSRCGGSGGSVKLGSLTICSCCVTGCGECDGGGGGDEHGNRVVC